MSVNTAMIANLSLKNSSFFRGTDFNNHPVMDGILGDSTRQPWLLFPGDDATDIRAIEPSPPPTLVVLDGTWWQAQKLLKMNPKLARLPRVAIHPDEPSAYRIRRQPDAQCISTVEAIAYCLRILEGDLAADALLRPFHRMVEAQLEWANQNRGKSSRHQKSRKPQVPEALVDPARDVVVAIGELNAWRRGTKGVRAELIHWVASRLSTGERLEAVLDPTEGLAPSCAVQTELTTEDFQQGVSHTAFIAAWTRFLRPTDVVCSWGTFGMELVSELGASPVETIDIRQLTAKLLFDRARSLERTAEQFGQANDSAWARGRAGRRHALLTGIVKKLVARGIKERDSLRSESNDA